MRDIFPALTKELGEAKGGDVLAWYMNTYGVRIEDEAPASVVYEVFGLTPEELLYREAFLMCKRFPDVLPGSDVYAYLLKAYKEYFHAGKDTYETDKEAREALGMKTGEEVLSVFRTLPAEALAPLRMEI